VKEAKENVRAIVLVEGLSDQIALEALARKRRVDLAEAGVAVVPIGGAHAVRRFVERFDGARLVGLCDAGEEPVFRRVLERYHVCVEDLEDELIRAHGAAGVEALLAQHHDLGPFRTFQKQPAWRARPVEAQLRRFMGSADRRKLRYARVLVEALDPPRVPHPLAAALEDALAP
jgi:hypothetical protein